MRRGVQRLGGHGVRAAVGITLGASLAAAVVLQALAPTVGSQADARFPAASKPSSVTVPVPSSTTTSSTTTTTAPPKATTPAPTPAPAPHRPAPAPAPSPAPAAVHHGIVPPAEPPSNIAPSPNFLNSCSGTTYDDSSGCVNASLAAITNARAQEGLGPMVLPSNWTSLTVEQQIFVITNLERTARGLAPMAGMVDSLDQASYQGAAAATDPEPPSGFPFQQWGSNWAGAVGNPLEAMYFWMYDDGPGSANIDCTASNTSGCWGHRINVLLNLNCSSLNCVMGTGYDATGYQNDPSLAEILADTSSAQTLVFSWQQEQAYF